jgi:hypothetical protein
VHFDYEPAERASYDEPGCDAGVSINAVYAGCHDVTAELNDDLVERIEAKCLESIAEQASDAKADSEIDRYESRRDDELAGDYA